MSKKNLVLLIFGLFLFRILYGLCSEFWFEDELQIYLIGLEFYTTGIWPYFGPDVVYTHSQIPGALQGLLTGAPFYLLAMPEAPVILLNIISFSALAFFAWYICKRIPELQQWFVWTMSLSLPWMLNFSTHVVNPSYVLPFSIMFFVSLFELLPLYEKKIFNCKIAALIMGVCTSLIMQLHMSWVLLLPFSLLGIYLASKKAWKNFFIMSVFYLIGFSIGAILLIPTYIKFGMSGTGGTENNLIFNFENIKNVITVLMRYISLATYEIPYMLGGNTKERLEVIRNAPWIAPFAVILLVTGWAQIAFLIVSAFLKKDKSRQWIIIRNINIFAYLLIFISFFFSVKGPSSHTFYLIMPLPLMYSFYCYRRVLPFYRKWRLSAALIIAFSFIFYSGIMYDGYYTRSLYKDRDKAKSAIEKKDYRILGTRRTETWNQEKQ